MDSVWYPLLVLGAIVALLLLAWVLLGLKEDRKDPESRPTAKRDP